MLIQLKNKDTLHFDDFFFQCAIGKKGINSKKKRVIFLHLKEYLQSNIFITDLTDLQNQKPK